MEKPKEPRCAELPDFLAKFLVEILAGVDFCWDVFLVTEIAKSDHNAWFCIFILTFLWPFFIQSSPFLQLKLNRMRVNDRGVCLRMALSIVSTTPFMLGFLFFIDILH